MKIYESEAKRYIYEKEGEANDCRENQKEQRENVIKK